MQWGGESRERTLWTQIQGTISELKISAVLFIILIFKEMKAWGVRHWAKVTCIHAQLLSRVRLFVTPWTVARQASLTMGFSRQEYWSGLPCPLPGDLPSLGIEPESFALQVDILLLSHLGSPKQKIPPRQSNGGLCAQVRKQPLCFRVSQSSLTTKTSCHSASCLCCCCFCF